MTMARNAILSMLLWVWGGAVYFMLEVIYKSIIGHSEQISWTMLVLATILCIPVERMGAELPWNMPLWLQSLICSVLVTVVEFFSGCVLNLWLGLNIWDYSNMIFNLFGQICLLFFFVWWGLCFVFIPVFDWLRWCVNGGEKPHYRIFLRW